MFTEWQSTGETPVSRKGQQGGGGGESRKVSRRNVVFNAGI